MDYKDKNRLNMTGILLASMPKVLIIGRRICTKDWSYTKYKIQNYELMFFYKGVAYVTLDGENYTLREGDCLFLKPGQIFSCKTNQKEICNYYIIHFQVLSPTFDFSQNSASEVIDYIIKEYNLSRTDDVFNIPQIDRDYLFLFHIITLSDYKEKVFTIVEQAIREKNLSHLHSNTKISCYLCEILVLLSRLSIAKIKLHEKTTKEEMPRKLQEAVFFIHDNYAEDIDLKSISDIIDVSPQYLISIFKKYFKQTPINYLSYFRISRAKDLLVLTSLTIKEITFDIGLNNPYYFSRLFKRIEGVTPTEYRKNLLMK